MKEHLGRLGRALRCRRAAAGAAGALVLFGVWVRCGPLPAGLLDLEEHVSTEVLDRTGAPLYVALSEKGGRSRPLDPRRLPETLVQATLAAEDARFFHHPGVDPLAIARAVWHDLRAGELVEGGSTITQQLAKVLTGRRRTAAGKLREMVLALRLEHHLSKPEILALYLSVAPYGNQLMGADAASRAYFGVPAESLTPAQAALLAGLPQRPTALDPYRHLDRARRRQAWVLKRMRDLGSLSAADHDQALSERLQVRRRESAFLAPHFVERVRAAAGTPPPRRLETTLDAALQREVTGILSAHRARLQAHGAHNVAVAVLDNRTSGWIAWEGSGDYADAEHGGTIDGVVTPRQPGSALKPFTYALAFERGFSPASVLPDVPSHFPTAEPGVLYSPRNYDGVFRGPLLARAALAGSENVPAVWVLSRVGVPDLLRLLRRAGMTTLQRTPDHYGYALTMGDAEVRLDEMVAAYAILARGGVWRTPRLRRDAEPAAGETPDGVRVVDERTAYWVADVLSDDAARAYVFGRGGSLAFPFPVAAKTGTSQAYHDNWTIGFTRDVTVGVWVGNFDRTPLRNSSGVTGAAPIFHDVMLAAQRRVGGGLPAASETVLPRPAGLVPRPVCALSGRAATALCPRVQTEWLPAGERAECGWHVGRAGRVTVAWPPVYRSWARARGLLDTRIARPIASGGAPQLRPAALATPRRAASASLRILNPPAGAVYLRDPTLRDAFQTLPLRAESGRSDRLTWEVDGRVVGTSPADGALEWPLARGPHVITVSDPSGRKAETTIEVR